MLRDAALKASLKHKVSTRRVWVLDVLLSDISPSLHSVRITIAVLSGSINARCVGFE